MKNSFLNWESFINDWRSESFHNILCFFFYQGWEKFCLKFEEEIFCWFSQSTKVIQLLKARTKKVDLNDSIIHLPDNFSKPINFRQDFKLKLIQNLFNSVLVTFIGKTAPVHSFMSDFLATMEEENRRKVRKDWKEKLSGRKSFSELVIREMKQIEINN